MVRKLSAVVLLLFLFAGSATAFAWWDTLDRSETEVVTIGVGTRLSLKENTQSAEGNLIPLSANLKEGDVKDVVFTYTLSLDEEITGTLPFSVVVNNLEVGGVANPFSLVNVKVDVEGQDLEDEDALYEIGNEDITVTITLTITDPSEEDDIDEAYEAYAGKDITFTVDFSVGEFTE